MGGCTIRLVAPVTMSPVSNDPSFATMRCVTPLSLRHTIISPSGDTGFGENDCEPLSPKIKIGEIGGEGGGGPPCAGGGPGRGPCPAVVTVLSESPVDDGDPGDFVDSDVVGCVGEPEQAANSSKRVSAVAFASGTECRVAVASRRRADG